MKLYEQDYLFGKVDLSNAEPGSLKAILHLTDLGGAEKEVTFAASFAAPDAPGGGEHSDHDGKTGHDEGDGHDGHDH
jgi:hypothetical protein